LKKKSDERDDRSSPLDGLDPSILMQMSDGDFQHKIRSTSRGLTAKAMATYVDVMDESDDDAARVTAADRIIKLSEAQQERSLPSGLTEEIFAMALAGLGRIAALSQASNPEPIFRNVTPAKADPRPFALIDDSPLSVPPSVEPERKENVPPEDQEVSLEE